MKKENILKFGSEHNGIINDIVPAKKHIPNWYKSIKSYGYGNLVFDSENINMHNIKSCVPFLDSLSTGYMIELWCDIHVKINDDGQSHYFTWSGAKPIPVGFRDSNENPIPIPIGCESSHYVWLSPYCIKTPKDHSLLITHPFNRFDLPFITLTGIVDAGKAIGPGNIPFFMKKDFEGVIERGTPIMQVLPFKKENWTSECSDEALKEGLVNKQKSINKFFGFYKKELWVKKSYE